MNTNVKKIIVSGVILLVFVIFTILLKHADVCMVQQTGTLLGFSSFNIKVHEVLGVNLLLYEITDWLGVLMLVVAFSFAILGFYQLVKRRSLTKVDAKLLLLGLFYIIVICLYILFEKLIVNYRPIFINGFLESSYPSSHVFCSVCIFGSGAMMEKHYIKQKWLSRMISFFLISICLLIVLGRIISGVHWITDIIGGFLLSLGLVILFDGLCGIISEKKKAGE